MIYIYPNIKWIWIVLDTSGHICYCCSLLSTSSHFSKIFIFIRKVNIRIISVLTIFILKTQLLRSISTKVYPTTSSYIVLESGEFVSFFAFYSCNDHDTIKYSLCHLQNFLFNFEYYKQFPWMLTMQVF